MTISQLRQTGTFRVETPPCEHQRINRYANDPKNTLLPACRHSASWVIDGKNYCGHHAGIAALAKLQRLGPLLRNYALTHDMIDSLLEVHHGREEETTAILAALRQLAEEAKK